jgi:hypothetical protein
MKAVKSITLLCLLVLCSLAIAGCSHKKETVVPTDQKTDENKAISQVKAEAEKMDAGQLRAAALKCKEAVEAKSAEVDKLAKELMQNMVADKSGDKVKNLNARMSTLNKSTEALAEQFQVYYDKLKAKGGDLSGLDLK